MRSRRAMPAVTPPFRRAAGAGIPQIWVDRDACHRDELLSHPNRARTPLIERPIGRVTTNNSRTDPVGLAPTGARTPLIERPIGRVTTNNSRTDPVGLAPCSVQQAAARGQLRACDPLPIRFLTTTGGRIKSLRCKAHRTQPSA